MLLKSMIAVYTENYAKPINTQVVFKNWIQSLLSLDNVIILNINKINVTC
jgi:hypothetical protein